MINKIKLIISVFLTLILLINLRYTVSASEPNINNEEYKVEDEAIPLSSISALQPKLNTVSIVDLICTSISIAMCLTCLFANKIKKYVSEVQSWQVLIRSITILPAFISIAFLMLKEDISGSVILFSRLSLGMILYSLSSIALTIVYIGILKDKASSVRRLKLND